MTKQETAIGIDLGGSMGLAYRDPADRARIRAIQWDLHKTSTPWAPAHSRLWTQMRSLIEMVRPRGLIIEIPVAVNLTTYPVVGQLHIIELLCERHYEQTGTRTDIAVCRPNTVRKDICGHGRASEELIAEVAQRLAGLKAPPSSHVADAIVALEWGERNVTWARPPGWVRMLEGRK